MSEVDLQGKSVLLAGCGDIGTGLGERLLARGARVCGLRRQPDALPDGFEKLAADLSKPESLSGLHGRYFDQVVITLTPGAFTEDAYRQAYVTGLQNLLTALDTPPGFLVFASSTSVYHQDDHKWVAENSPTEPTAFAGVQTLAAESLISDTKLPHVNVRLAGIYGPGRTALLDQVRGGEACGPEDRLYTNRIHRDDVIGFLEHLSLMHERGADLHPIYIATDSHSATRWDVQSWLATRIGVDPFSLKTGPIPGRTSKRCRNTLLRESGYQLVYRDFMSGYEKLLDS